MLQKVWKALPKSGFGCVESERERVNPNLGLGFVEREVGKSESEVDLSVNLMCASLS